MKKFFYIVYVSTKLVTKYKHSAINKALDERQ